MKKILLHPKMKRLIAVELGVSMQTVDMSLKGVFKSETAIKIRQRAAEMLKKESEIIT